MKHHLEWKESTLNIRCWACSEILISISTDGSLLSFDSMPNRFEINCPNCYQTCEYSLFEDEFGSFLKSHNWDSDIDGVDFNGKTGENNRNLLRQYKSILLKNEITIKFFEAEFDIVSDYLEFLAKYGLDGFKKDNKSIDAYMEDYREYDDLSIHREKLFRRAINRYYGLIEDAKLER
jgi:phage FluMu protein Com